MVDVMVVVVALVVCERGLNLRDSRRNTGEEPRAADVAIATFAAEDAELDGLSVGLLSSEAQRANISVQE